YDRCTITTNVTIGDHTHLNVGCAVQHDSTVGAFVQFSPGVFVNGDCEIGDDVFLGTGTIVTRGCSVRPAARVGAGAVGLAAVAAGATVVGVPARPVQAGDPCPWGRCSRQQLVCGVRSQVVPPVAAGGQLGRGQDGGERI